MRNEANRKLKQGGNRRGGLIAGTLAAGVAALALTGGAMQSATPAFAEPVTVNPPVQNFGFADVVEKVSPAVVSVRVTQDVAAVSDESSEGPSPFESLPDDHPLKRFFGDRAPGGPGGESPLRPRRNQPRTVMGQGSGFFISDDGFVVTNNHVVEGGSKYVVVMDDGKEYTAKLIGTDKRTDLALLKVDADNTKFTYVAFGDDDAVRVGEWVVAVGNPFGLGGSVTAGIVSARGRDIGVGPYDDFLQIDAAVNRGNSGGPAFDLNGKVIGVNTAIFSPSGGNVGIAFAIPASVAKNVIQSLRDSGTVQRGWLGVQISQVTDDIASAVGLTGDKGAIVTLPDSETPATKAGIQSGDVITAVNGETVDGPRELARKVASFAPGKTIDVTVWRDNAAKQITVKLGNISTLDEASSGQDSSSSSKPSIDPSALSGYGLTLTPSEDGSGVVVTDVAPDSSASDKGVQAGDTIVAVNGKSVTTQADVKSAIDEASKSGRKAALFQLKNGDQNRFVALPIAKS